MLPFRENFGKYPISQEQWPDNFIKSQLKKKKLVNVNVSPKSNAERKSNTLKIFEVRSFTIFSLHVDKINPAKFDFDSQGT